jgi:hypothetical protein
MSKLKLRTIESIFQKYKLDAELVTRFKIKDGASCLNALHYLNACGYASAKILRCLSKDCLHFYGVERMLLEKAIRYYIYDCYSSLKSAYILFPVFFQKVPETVSRLF